MPLFALSSIPGQAYWLLLALVIVVIIAFSIYYLVRNHKFQLLFMQTISQITDQIAALDRCHIDNLEPTREALQNEKFPLLGAFGDKLVSDADRLYQGKWIQDPTEQLTTDRILTRADYRANSIEIPIQVLSVSVLATSVFLVFGLSGGETNASVIRMGFLPAMIGAVFALLLFFQSYRNRQSMTRGLTHLAETIMEKVPVFRELAGTAALIESFFRYDRQMAESISVLSSTVDELTHNELAAALANNVKIVMEEEVAPPLVKAADTLSELATELTQRQEDGMRDLADHFASSLAVSLDEQLRPFYQEISNLTQDLYEANKQTEISLGVMQEYKVQSNDIQQGLLDTIAELNVQRKNWQDDMSLSTESIHSLAETSKRLANLQSGTEVGLTQEISQLQVKIEELQDALIRVTQGLHLENQQGSDTVRALSESSQKTLGDLRQLTKLLVDQTDLMANQNQALYKSIESLEQGLNTSVEAFSSQLLAGVDQTLDTFDEGLAEISDRLSNTTAEINDTVGTWASDIRWSEEYRYRTRVEKDHEDSGQKEALMNILGGDMPGRSENVPSQSGRSQSGPSQSSRKEGKSLE